MPGARPGRPRHHAGLPRPQAPPTWRAARGAGPDRRPRNGGHRRPPRAPAAAASPPRGGGAGRFQNRPARWGRGGESGLVSSLGRGGYLTPSPQNPTRSSRPPPRGEQPPIRASRPSPARPRLPHTHPWTPFSLLPPRSLNVRLPLPFPLGAALRRREARNLGRYHRAGPRGGTGWTIAASPSRPPRPLQPSVKGAGLGGAGRNSPRRPRPAAERRLGGRGGVIPRARPGCPKWSRPRALGTVSKEPCLEARRRPAAGGGKGPGPGTTAD